MSKPSGTNYPKTFRWYFFQVHVFSCMSCPSSQNHYFWWLWSGCSPLPIPNREVKPRIADDTALVCGKVGRRQFFIRSSKRDSFFCLPSPQRIVSRRIPPVTVFNRALRLPPSLVKTSRFGYLFFRLSFLSSSLPLITNHPQPSKTSAFHISHFTFHILQIKHIPPTN